MFLRSNPAQVWFTRGGWFGGLWHPATLAAASVPPPVLLQGGGHGVHPLDPQCWRTFRSSRHEDSPHTPGASLNWDAGKFMSEHG
jgi:hypothetical protein